MSERLVVGLGPDGVLTVTLNRPDKRNAIDSEMVGALSAELERAELDQDVAVVVIRGAGKDFCAGADLAELLASVDQTLEQNNADAARLGAVFTSLRSLPKPVVAVVHGRALAGGCGLAGACDMVLAHEDAVFGYPEIQRGFVPAMVMAMLTRSVGEKVAFDLVATGRLLSASAAMDIGLVSRVVGAASFDEEVAGIVGQLASSSPTALALIKKQLHELEGRSFDDAIALGAKVNAVARSTPDFKEAVSRFLKK
ncbi:MAG: enoyl-CoA hydratase/isomerase family protein [Gemmatimonadetes bacterium]|nr:enoyl-CoA hydratase/isomerase family protein [Gemmatimonadota bacterium]